MQSKKNSDNDHLVYMSWRSNKGYVAASAGTLNLNYPFNN